MTLKCSLFVLTLESWIVPTLHFIASCRPRYTLSVDLVCWPNGFIPVEEYLEAGSDILTEESMAIVSKLHSNHGNDLKLIAQHLLECVQVEHFRVTSIDRLGMDVRVTQKGKRRNNTVTDEFRIGF